MSKYYEASEEIKKLVEQIADEMDLVRFGIDFQPICTSKGKEVCKVVKANELAEYASKRNDLIFVICYEEAFELADERTKYLWLRTEMDKVSFDDEKDKIIIGCPSITIPVGIYEKYRDEAVNAALTGQYTLSQIEEKRKEEADAKKARRTKKKM